MIVEGYKLSADMEMTDMSEAHGSRKKRPNLGDIAYDEIKEMILTGELPPGQRLVLDSLSETLNLSVTPIRDALNKLAQEDLVVIRPRTSHTVVEIAAEDASDILDLRLMLEAYALQTAGERLASFPVAYFKRSFNKIGESGDQKEFIAVDRDFHAQILALSSNRRLPKLYGYLQNLLQVISIQAIQTEGRIDEANQEHLDLLDAIEAGNVMAAMDALKDHFGKIKQVFAEF